MVQEVRFHLVFQEVASLYTKNILGCHPHTLKKNQKERYKEKALEVF